MSSPEQNSTVLYLYGISHAVPAHLAMTDSVDGASTVEVMDVAGWKCWTSRVSRRAFADELQQNMERLDWLADCGVRHQKVVSAIAGAVDILPARFGTVFLTEKSLQEDIVRRKDAIAVAFERIKDSEEWGVKIFSVPQSEEATVAKSATSGADYLRKKATALHTAKPTNSANVDEFERELKAVSVASAAGGKASAGQRNLIWSASFLIRRKDRDRFSKLVQSYADQWAGRNRIEVTGPWPPYSFAGAHVE